MSAVFAASPVLAADATPIPPAQTALPAVSGPNWKASLSGGGIAFDGLGQDERYTAGLSYSVPLGFSTGLQFDATLGSVYGEFTGSFGTHLFGRDPSSHLFGVWAQYSVIGSNDIFRIVPEAEFYVGNLTLKGVAGYETSDDVGGDVFAVADAAWYPHDDLKLYTGFRRTRGLNIGAIGFEWQTGHSLGQGSVGLYGEGQIGQDGHQSVWAGLRSYFGGETKSLIRRHREDDPDDPDEALKQGPCVVPVSSDLKDGTTCPVKLKED